MTGILWKCKPCISWRPALPNLKPPRLTYACDQLIYRVDTCTSSLLTRAASVFCLSYMQTVELRFTNLSICHTNASLYNIPENVMVNIKVMQVSRSEFSMLNMSSYTNHVTLWQCFARAAGKKTGMQRTKLCRCNGKSSCQ